MKKIQYIYESEKVYNFLRKRQLIKQYEKSCKLIIAGFFGKVDFKLRQPKYKRIWAFRINKQFRAYGYFHENNFIVYHIDNHQ